MFWAIGCVSILLGAGLWIARAASARRLHYNHTAHLKHIYFALANYSDVKKQMPPPVLRDAFGNELSSWRFQIAPFIDCMGYGQDFSRHWQDPSYRQLASVGIGYFNVDPQNPGMETSFLAVAGAGTAFDESATLKLPDLPPGLILVIATAKTKRHWMEPGDLELNELLQARGTLGQCVRSVDPRGVYVLFADGMIWCLSKDTPMNVFDDFLTVKGASAHSRDIDLATYAVTTD
jgi:hypothetical protein